MAENGGAIQILELSRASAPIQPLATLHPPLSLLLPSPSHSYPKVDLSGVEHGFFAQNRATFTGGAMFADEASSTAIYVEYLHRRAENVAAGCFLTFGNELTTKVHTYLMHYHLENVNYFNSNKKSDKSLKYHFDIIILAGISKDLSPIL